MYISAEGMTGISLRKVWQEYVSVEGMAKISLGRIWQGYLRGEFGRDTCISASEREGYLCGGYEKDISPEDLAGISLCM